ncbi:hypothetical protein BYT27DRAFT_7201705 [Phlegmacium glaucopus]|nr:hypothetical protein BYT27DRAFT_7201705 [Phlegmacium glaucopus]
MERVVIRQLTSPSKDDAEAAIAVLTAAFTDGISYTVETGNDPVATELLVRAVVAAGLMAGEVYAAYDGELDGKVVGVAVWFPPGREMFDDDQMKEEIMTPFMNSLPTKLRKWWEDELWPKYNELLVKGYAPGMKTGSWALGELATVASARQNGVARALVNVVRDKARMSGDCLTVETHTELNVSIYQRLGFKVVASTDGAVFHNEHGSFAMWALEMD